MAQFQTDVLACATDGTSPASEATVVWKAWRMAAFATVDGASNHERFGKIGNRALAVAAALTILATYSPGLAAQTAPAAAPAKAPRIGLALSGGGARGIAHVGVLKVLEELRVPIHCVTGTSMGAIVGATFAAGRPPAEMEKIVLAADWDEIFRDKPPRDEIAVRRKIDDYKTLFAPEFGVKDGGLALPKGVIAGVSIESFFRACLRRPSASPISEAADPVPRDGHRHRDGPIGRARPRQPRPGDAREHVGARRDHPG